MATNGAVVMGKKTMKLRVKAYTKLHKGNTVKAQ